MRFTNSELEMIYQYAAPTKAETIGGMKETGKGRKERGKRGRREKERERPGIADHKGQYRADFEGRTEPAEKTRTGTIIKQPQEVSQ